MSKQGIFFTVAAFLLFSILMVSCQGRSGALTNSPDKARLAVDVMENAVEASEISPIAAYQKALKENRPILLDFFSPT